MTQSNSLAYILGPVRVLDFSEIMILNLLIDRYTNFPRTAISPFSDRPSGNTTLVGAAQPSPRLDHTYPDLIWRGTTMQIPGSYGALQCQDLEDVPVDQW